jgi:2-polyprenyl-3-methyl-5-hydroxy-6-metoxy-1,4-benzoquinol methylase
MRFSSKIRYLLWAAVRYPFANAECPACGSAATTMIRRKAFVTLLYECMGCGLRFRVPKDTPNENRDFYQEEYEQGATTECPDSLHLNKLIETSFLGSQNDFSTYIGVLRTLGLKPQDVVLDYGSSWGYGSWQLMRLGCQVYSYEIGATRARYARDRLGCRMLARPSDVPTPVDVLFSAHVIEHLPNPNLLWQAARSILKPSSGIVVLFMPNGQPARASEDPSTYHLAWGKAHPLFLTARALESMAKRHGFIGRAYSSPYDLKAIADGAKGELLGGELLFIARQLPGDNGTGCVPDCELTEPTPAD